MEISREEQDAFALRSQEWPIRAIKSGYFKEEIVPVVIPQKKGDPDRIRPGRAPADDEPGETGDAEACFQKGRYRHGRELFGHERRRRGHPDHGKEKCERSGLKPLGRFVSCALAGVEPKYMGIGPAYATPKALQRAGLKLAQMDIVECNEAFASQTLAVMKELAGMTAQGGPGEMESQRGRDRLRPSQRHERRTARIWLP